MDYLWIALGSALGGAARYWVSGWTARHLGEAFPAGTLVVNVTGSLLIGFLAAWTAPEGRHWLSPAARQFLMLGALGGFTTFSSFSLQTLLLVREGEWALAGLNVLSSIILCLLAVVLGYALALWASR